MSRTGFAMGLVLVVVAALLGALLTSAGCHQNDGAGPPPVASKKPAVEVGAAEPGEVPGETAASTSPATPATITVKLYWVEAGENALAIERTLPYTQAVATAAVKALIVGPTTQEKSTWPAISSAIPADTRLLGIKIADGVAKVDLSKEFESGGGTFSMTARLAQVVYTLDQFPTVDAVEFYIEGKKVQMFSGEGILLDGPQRLDDFDRLIPIDA